MSVVGLPGVGLTLSRYQCVSGLLCAGRGSSKHVFAQILKPLGLFVFVVWLPGRRCSADRTLAAWRAAVTPLGW